MCFHYHVKKIQKQVRDDTNPVPLQAGVVVLKKTVRKMGEEKDLTWILKQ